MIEQTQDLPYITCPRCQHEWLKRTAKPLKCPRCQRYLGAGTAKKSAGTESKPGFMLTAEEKVSQRARHE